MNTIPFRAACSFLVLAGCLAATTAGAAPFSSPRGYTLSVPAGWHVRTHPAPGEDANIVVNRQAAVGHRMTTPTFQIQFRSIDPRITSADLKTLNEGVLSTVRQSFPDLKVLSQTSSTLGGVRDLDCVFTATASGISMRFHEVLVIRRGSAFRFSSFCPSQVYPKYAPAYAQMLSSVRWKP